MGDLSALPIYLFNPLYHYWLIYFTLWVIIQYCFIGWLIDQIIPGLPLSWLFLLVGFCVPWHTLIIEETCLFSSLLVSGTARCSWIIWCLSCLRSIGICNYKEKKIFHHKTCSQGFRRAGLKTFKVHKSDLIAFKGYVTQKRWEFLKKEILITQVWWNFTREMRRKNIKELMWLQRTCCD